jgi:serine/threonine-protein kinase
MDPRRWERIQHLFHDALERPAERRQAFVHDACKDDPELAEEVLALLAEDEAAASLLDRGVAETADAVLEGSIVVPRRIGPYRVTRMLGEGGMGVVCLAEREDLDNVVAIKFLRDARLSPHRRERFLREQRFLARLTHPSISRLYDAGTLPDGTPYFVMEYVDGEPLTRFCERHDLSLDARLRLFRQACGAVQYAHRRALIHRDLKPSNILALYDRRGKNAAVKLLDFGIAKQEDDSGGATRTVFGLMTPAYAAPEQLRGEPVGVATDVYSLGVVLYELLTGGLPFDLAEQTPFEAARIVTTMDPARPSTKGFTFAVGKGAWADLDVLCLTAMHRDPDRRYPTVEALARDVDHYLAGEPLEARPDSTGYRVGKFVRRNRRAVTAGVAIVAAVIALVTFYTMRLSAARDAALAEAARTQRIQSFMLDLFEGGDEVASPEEGLLVTTLIDRGVREARVLGGEPAIQAELYQTLGGVYHRMSDFDRAQELLESALAGRRELLGDDHPDVGESLVSLGLLAGDRGKLDEAERLTREGLELARARLPARHPRIAEALTALGDVLVERGDYEQAFAVLDEAIELQRGQDDPTALMTTLRSLADAHFYAGNYEDSDELNRRLLAMTEEHLGTSHPAYATCLINLGATRAWLGYLEEAERYYRDALVINEAYHGREHPAVASNLALISAVLNDQKRHDEAREVILEALAVQEAVYGPDHYQVALTLNRLATADLARGDLDAAEAGFARELAIYRATVGDEHPSTATGLSNMATIHFRRGDYDRSEQTMRQSLATFRAALKPDHMNVAIAHVKLGRLLAAVERFEEARDELIVGYEILTAQANPSISWIDYARGELAGVYEALGDDDRAAEFREPLEPPADSQ